MKIIKGSGALQIFQYFTHGKLNDTVFITTDKRTDGMEITLPKGFHYSIRGNWIYSDRMNTRPAISPSGVEDEVFRSMEILKP